MREHHIKVAIGAPILFVLLWNGAGSAQNYFFYSSERGLFAEVGDEIPISLVMRASGQVNAAGGYISFPHELFELRGISRINSAIDIWSEEPGGSAGYLRFSGGMTDEGGWTGEGNILTLGLVAKTPGKAEFLLKEGELLAANGVGTNIASGAEPLTLYIRAKGDPTPDVNGDGALTISDANALYLRTFRAYDPRHDMNKDGKVSWADVRTLLSLM